MIDNRGMLCILVTLWIYHDQADDLLIDHLIDCDRSIGPIDHPIDRDRSIGPIDHPIDRSR